MKVKSLSIHPRPVLPLHHRAPIDDGGHGHPGLQIPLNSLDDYLRCYGLHGVQSGLVEYRNRLTQPNARHVDPACSGYMILLAWPQRKPYNTLDRKTGVSGV